MKILILFSLLVASGFGSPVGEDLGPQEADEQLPEEPATRSTAQFGLMINCMTGRWPTDYIVYGCWCGLGGKGTPVDETDQCCKDHDKCYERLLDIKTCKSWQLYAEPYQHSRKNCGSSYPSITCDSNQSSCGYALCQCDRTAAQCFKTARYDSKYTLHWNLFC